MSRNILGMDAANAAAPAAEDTNFDFDALIGDIMENPERLLDENLTAEQILEIQKRLNPYAGIAGPPPAPERKRVAACSYTNLREDYLRRFTATSFVGFIYQMFQEWEVPAEQRRWVPASSATAAAKSAGDYDPFAADRLAELLESAATVARESANATAESAQLRRDLATAQLLATENPVEDLEKAVETSKQISAIEFAMNQAEEKAAGLLYAATHAATRIGAEANNRLRSTADAGLTYTSVREVLGKYPLPPPPSALEAPPALAKSIIENFLNQWLQFDPTVHVRAGHDAKTVAAALAEKQIGAADAAPTIVDKADSSHLTFAALRANPPAAAPEHAAALQQIRNAGPRAVAALTAILREPDLCDAATAALATDASREAFTHYLMPVPVDSAAGTAANIIPPQDTFHRWAYYTEVNYEELRTVTEALYPERPDLDWALALWDVFEGTSKEVDTAFDKHCQRYQDEVPSAIRALEFGAWSLLGDFKENRKKIQFYNNNTDVLKRILDRHADDKRIGAELMRNRVRQAKARNIAEEGPDASGLTSYRRNLAEKGLAISSKGAEKVISGEEMRRLERASGSIKAAKELEVLDQMERTIQNLGAAEKVRELTSEEAAELERARLAISRAHEMADVPDDAIQVDVFTNDPKSGTFGKTHFYTKADDVDEPEMKDARVLGSRRPNLEAIANIKSDHPASQASLAPYAMEYLHSVSAAERAGKAETPQ